MSKVTGVKPVGEQDVTQATIKLHRKHHANPPKSSRK